MNWKKIEIPLKELYSQKNIENYFKKDSEYLKNSFLKIEKIWEEQFESIKKINYVMFSEAPLWGNSEKYMYNPLSQLSQFFYKSDLEYVLKKKIHSKIEFLESLKDIGFIIVDISPFALNEIDTSINYRKISKKDYKNLILKLKDSFLLEKLQRLKTKTTNKTSYFFRYLRVKNLFDNLIFSSLIDLNMINENYHIKDIAQKGGGIDRKKLDRIINLCQHR